MPFNIFGQPQDEEELNIAGQPPVDQEPPVEQPLPLGVQPPPAAAEPEAAPAPEAAAEPPPYKIENPTVRDYIQKLYGDKYSDEARQKLVDQNKEDASGLDWGAGLTALASGLQGGNAAEAGMNYKKNEQAKRDKALETFDAGRKNLVGDQKLGMELRNDAMSQEQLAQERSPTSDASKLAQEAARKMGVSPEVAAKLTAEQFKAQGPLYEKIYKVEQDKLLRKDTLNQKSADRAVKLNDDLVAKLKDDLDPNRARGGNLAKNQAQIDQADRLRALYTESNGDLRNLDSRQMEELAIGMNKMLSGSSNSAASQVEALVPKSARGDAQKLREWLTNDPQGSDQRKFVARMAETVEREHDIAQDQVRRAQVQRLSAYEKLKKSDPERYQQILQSYGIDKENIDEKGQYARKKKEMAPAGLVKMIDPNGVPRMVAQDQVDAAIKAGGKLADTAVANNAPSSGGRYQ